MLDCYRILSLSRDYSHRRECFGNKISQFPLHVDTLASMELEARGGTVLFLEVARCVVQVFTESTGLRLITCVEA
jgi:alkylation response protein AidB-like acyl-CoA dehydrogenase